MIGASPAIGVDIGGTKIAVGLVSDEGRLLERVVESTPSDAETIPQLVAKLVSQVAPTTGAETVGVGAAGFMSSDRSTVRFSPNIDWVDEPLGDKLSELLGVHVVIENDANAAAWGEFRFGAGISTDIGADISADDLLLVTIGTGIGGGIVHGGALVRGASGMAAEIGHIRVVPHGRECGCGQRGCLEQYASGPALIRAFHERSRQGESVTVTGAEITELARDGDPHALESLNEVGTWLGQGIASVAAVLDPSVVVIGGGVSEAGELLIGPIRTSFDAHLSGSGHRPRIQIRPAALGNVAGLVGAADLSRRGE